MKKENIEKLIEAIKQDSELLSIFWDRINYHSFFWDLDGIWLIIYPFWWIEDDCIITDELVQIQIIDWITASTSLQMKWYMEKVEKFLNSKIKSFDWFNTFRINSTWDEIMLKNNKERFVFTKRFLFFY